MTSLEAETVRMCVCVFVLRRAAEIITWGRGEKKELEVYMYNHGVHAFVVQDFEELKKLLIKRGIYYILTSLSHPTHSLSLSTGDMYLQRVADSRQKIAHVANPFIRDGTVLFIYSFVFFSCAFMSVSFGP